MQIEIINDYGQNGLKLILKSIVQQMFRDNKYVIDSQNLNPEICKLIDWTPVDPIIKQSLSIVFKERNSHSLQAVNTD